MNASELIKINNEVVATTLPAWTEGAQGVHDHLAKQGDSPAWLRALDALPTIEATTVDLGPVVQIGTPQDAQPAQRESLRAQLEALHPWRKGPFDFFGVHIDAEWRSDLKWARIEPHLTPLQDRRVLDVGCGNGYYIWRMLGDGAASVLGIDPSPNHFVQYLAARWASQAVVPHTQHGVVCARLEELPQPEHHFDTVFSLGVLSHNRHPMDHLGRLLRTVRPGGELVLETLIVEEEHGPVLRPQRYARMKNVYEIPSMNTLVDWVEQARFSGVRVVDVTQTTPEEQRSTAWMRYESLRQALHPTDPQRTVEGQPSPIRAVLLAQAPI